MKKLLLISLVAAMSFLLTACSSGPRPSGAPEKVKNYLIGDYEDAKSVASKLEAQGFEILATVKPFKKKDIEVVVFTNDHVKKLANRPLRGLLAQVLRVTVNKEKNQIKVTNPMLYFKAYLQHEYKEGDEKPITTAIMKAFPSLKTTDMQKNEDGEMEDMNVEQLAYDKLADYHFMIGMPYYHDMDDLRFDDDINALLKSLKKGAAKIKSSLKRKKRKKENLCYLIKLSDKRYVAGLRLSKRTEKFAKKIGDHNVGLLPWGVLIEEVEEDGKKTFVARTLGAKYRIALNYSDLDMGGFMGIMTVPGAINKELTKVFKAH
jgi:hypothetical protein